MITILKKMLCTSFPFYKDSCLHIMSNLCHSSPFALPSIYLLVYTKITTLQAPDDYPINNRDLDILRNMDETVVDFCLMVAYNNCISFVGFDSLDMLDIEDAHIGMVENDLEYPV